ncbi:tRNA pseudouridine55 synthase [Desulfosalsimonas propionicica]|uniref:tRNA pseudouridine synthase B n=1 Tax=Desulfosalsimonas propionicica TaxID=332175 RepID=A0A7W0C5U4_9BACT|nr:tRNA pseudouridine(55) synthase TruB [Desulfosalsimonas propionicica]MBA2879764.1 tRNA pseudouridine55 synthase [Desulfosalsimonas propionicica]
MISMHGARTQERENSVRQTVTQATDRPDGILLVNKPANMTSAAVVSRIKRLPGVKKTGHTGTLDPFATGMLICPVNRATRLSRFFLHGTKQYRAVLSLGTETDTLDCTGEVTARRPVKALSEDRIRQAVQSFAGDIQQVPPVFSALKHNGVPLYRYARNGTPVEKPARTVHIESIRVTDIDLPDICFEVTCSAGTYIRSLCADIGHALGCGGHLSRLMRTESCGFGIADAAELADLEKVQTPAELQPWIISMAGAISDMPEYNADPGLLEKIRHGRPIAAEDMQPEPATNAGGRIRILDPEERLVAVIEKKTGKSPDKIDYSYCCVFHYT